MGLPAVLKLGVFPSPGNARRAWPAVPALKETMAGRLLTGSRKRHFVKSPPPPHMRPQGPRQGCIRTRKATHRAPRARGVLIKLTRLSAPEAGLSKSAIMRQAPARWPLPSTSCARSGRKKKQRSSPLPSEFLLPRNAVALRCHVSARFATWWTK